MKIIVKKTDLTEDRSVIAVAHNGEEIEWSVAFLEAATKKSKSVFDATVDPYELINKYWQYLSPARQNAIFEVYRRVRDVFSSVFGFDYENMTRELFPLIKELIDLHGIDEVKQWSDYHSGVRIPTNDPKLLVSYDMANTSKKPREGTYLLDDYRWLVAMSVLVRCVIPIWGTYIDRIKGKGSVGTNFKEYKAYQLLSQSALFEHPAMIKLREYVRFNTKPEQVKMSAMRAGLSTEEYPEWMLGVVVVRKLGCLDLLNTESTASAVTVLFNYIGHKLKNSDNSFGGVINEKKFEGTQGDGENNLSTLEGYRTPQEIAAGPLMAFRVYAERTVTFAQQICPTISPMVVNRSVDHVKKLHGQVPTDEQLQIMQMTVKKVLAPQALKYMNHETMMGIMGVVQAVLWHSGYPELAALATAKRADIDTVGGSEHRSRILDDQMTELAYLYPYARRPTAKPRPEGQKNLAQQEIETIEKALSKKNWFLTLPKEWVMELNHSENNRLYNVPSNFRIRLAEFVIKVAKGEF